MRKDVDTPYTEADDAENSEQGGREDRGGRGEGGREGEVRKDSR